MTSLTCPRCGSDVRPDGRCGCPPPSSATLSLPGELVAGTAASSGGTGTVPELPATASGIELAPNARLGRFVVLALVGEGAFGDVYRARDPHLDRDVAIKVAKPGSLGTTVRARRFLREAKAAANLHHPNIVPLYETGEDAGRYFLVTAFIDGRTLGAVVENARGGLPPTDAVGIARKLGRALAYAHGAGIVHRDVKPENVMVDAKGEPHLLDFGLAAREEAGDEKLTQVGALVGSPAYMSPEQATGDPDKIGPASDLYSLGVTLYELLTGRTPFSGPREVQLLLHQTQDPPPPRAVNPAVPRDLNTIVMKCLEKEPGRRYAGCGELADDLRRWQEGQPITARRVGRGERLARWARRNPSLATAVTGAAAVLVVGSAVAGYFAVEADRRATDAQNEAIRADTEAEAARLARDDAGREAARALAAEGRAKEEAAEAKRQKEYATDARNRAETATYAAQIGRGDSLLLAGKGASATVVLDQTRWDLRNWEFGYLRRQADQGAQVLRGHRGEVRCVRFNRDGTRLLTGGADATLREWDTRTGAALQVVRTPHTSEIHLVRYSADDRLLATASWDHLAGVYDAATGTLLYTLDSRAGFRDLRFSPTGEYFVTVGDHIGVQVWNTATGKPGVKWPIPRDLKDPAGHNNLDDLCFSPDGRRLAVAGDNGGFWVLDTATGAVVCQFLHGGDTNGVAFSPDGRQLATVGFDGYLRLWDAATGRNLRSIPAHRDNILDVSFSPDGRQLVTASWDRTVRTWDAGTGKVIAATPELGGWVNSARFSPDGSRIATGSADGFVALWRADLAAPRTTFAGHAREVTSVSFHPNGKQFLTGSGDATAAVWDTATGERVRTFGGQRGRVRAARFSPDGARVAVSDEQLVRVRDAHTGQVLATFDGHRFAVVGLAFSPDGSRVVTGSEDATACLWDAGTGKLLHRLIGHKTWVYGVCYSPNGRFVVSGSADKTARVWDATTGACVRTLTGHAAFVWAMTYSPDGKQLATASWDGTVKIWDAETWAELRTLRGHNGPVHGVSFTPDGSRLASASDDKTVKLWNPATGAELCSLREPGEQVLAVAVSPDGHQIVAGARNGKIAVVASRFENEVVVVDRPARVTVATFAADGRRLVVRDAGGGEVAVDLPPGKPGGPPPVGRELVSPDGRFEARIRGTSVRVLARSPLTVGYDAWAEVDARHRAAAPARHAEAATAAELAGDWFASAFHRERLLFQAPWDRAARGETIKAWVYADQPDRAAVHLGALLLDPVGGAPPANDPFSPGLRAELFDGVAFDRRLAVRITPRINLTDDQLDHAFPEGDLFSVRWTGSLIAPKAGTYSLLFHVDDGIRVWLDDQLLLDEWREPQVTTFKRDVHLTGRPQRIRVDYFQSGGSAACSFRWIPPGATQEELVPAACFRPFSARCLSRPVAPPPREVTPRNGGGQ